MGHEIHTSINAIIGMRELGVGRKYIASPESFARLAVNGEVARKGIMLIGFEISDSSIGINATRVWILRRSDNQQGKYPRLESVHDRSYHA
jgi:hypothetical protein